MGSFVNGAIAATVAQLCGVTRSLRGNGNASLLNGSFLSRTSNIICPKSSKISGISATSCQAKL